MEINSGESIKYKDFMKIRLDSYDDDLTLGKRLSLPVLNIAVKSVFQNENKYYPCDYEQKRIYIEFFL